MDPEKHPLKTTLRLSSGKEYQVLSSFLGLKRAKAEYGYNISKVNLTPEAAPDTLDRIEQATENVWLGILTFEVLSFDELAAQMVRQSDYEAVAQAYQHMLKYQLVEPKPEDAKKKSGRDRKQTSKK